MNRLDTCKECGCTFLAVTWLPCRVKGYCSDACAKPSFGVTDWRAVAIRGAILTKQANEQLDMLAMDRIGGEA